MKKVSKTLAIVFFLAVILTVTALACWPMYQGDINHTGQITDTAPHITSNPTVVCTPLPVSGSGWSGVDSEPVMHEENDGNTYAFVQYNGHSDYGGSIAKIKCNDGSLVWNITQATPTAANQLSSPLLDGNTLYYVYNNETSKVSGTLGTQSITKTLTLSVYLDAGGSYRLYIPSTITSGSSATMSVLVTRRNGGTPVYLNLDNDDPAETGSPTTRTLTTSSTTSALNKNYADVFSIAGTYDIAITYTLGSGSYKTGTCYLYQNHITLNKITDVTVSTAPTPSQFATNLPGSGQMNTPITTDGTYLYFGTWMSGTAHGSYYQVNKSTGSFKSFHQTDGSGFYWAGAVPVNTNNGETYNYVVFGGDGGYLYYRSISDFENVGGVYNLSTLLANALSGHTNAGNVRSTISSDGTYIYFTSQGPTGTCYLWRFLISTIGNTTPTYNVITLDGGSSTSTPAISQSNNLIYVGYYNGFSSGGIDVVKSNSNTFAIVKNISGLLPVQSSIDVYSDIYNDYDYIFFTTNASTVGGHCYCVSTTSPYTAVEVWNTASNNTCLQGMAACNGFLTFGNDSNSFYIVNP